MCHCIKHCVSETLCQGRVVMYTQLPSNAHRLGQNTSQATAAAAAKTQAIMERHSCRLEAQKVQQTHTRVVQLGGLAPAQRGQNAPTAAAQPARHTHGNRVNVSAVLHRHTNMALVTNDEAMVSCVRSGAALRAHPGSTLSMHHSMPFPADRPVPPKPQQPHKNHCCAQIQCTTLTDCCSCSYVCLSAAQHSTQPTPPV